MDSATGMTVSYRRHDGGLSEATFDGTAWQSEDRSLTLWLNQSAPTGVAEALALGCAATGPAAVATARTDVDAEW